MTEQSEDLYLCPVCEGAGDIKMAEKLKKCYHCRGRGKVTRQNEPAPSEVAVA